MFKMENDLALMILINITQILTLRMICYHHLLPRFRAFIKYNFLIFSVAIDQYVGLYMHKSKMSA